ncbi:hypothetical protein, partial [Staphylococcus aureus]
VTAMLLNASGERRWKINTYRCPVTTEAFEQQVWGQDGQPDKKTGHDHPCDAQGYLLVKHWPIVRNQMQRVTIGGV